MWKMMLYLILQPCNSFWGGQFEKAFFLMLGSSTPALMLNHQSFLQATYKKHEQLKRRHYDHRGHEIEHSTFTPLVLSIPPEAWGKQQPPFTKDSLPFSQTNGMRITVTLYGLVEMLSEFCSIVGLNYVHQRCSLFNEQTDFGQSHWFTAIGSWFSDVLIK